MILTENEQVISLSTEDEVFEYICQNSNIYKMLFAASFIAKGGEAIVFKIEHTGTDEIVAKCPIFDKDITEVQLATAYDSIFYESQTLKLLPFYKNMAEVKEEII